MANPTEKLSAAQLRAVAWIQGHHAAELGALGTEIGAMVAELTTELMDAKREAGHWKGAFDAVRNELKVLAAVCMRQLKTRRLVITRKELQDVPPNMELWVEGPEDGVRIYELRPKGEGSATH